MSDEITTQAPNDMTLAVITNNLVILPNVMKAFPFDVTKDFTPISMLVTIPMVLAVNSKVPATKPLQLPPLRKLQVFSKLRSPTC